MKVTSNTIKASDGWVALNYEKPNGGMNPTLPENGDIVRLKIKAGRVCQILKLNNSETPSDQEGFEINNGENEYFEYSEAEKVYLKSLDQSCKVIIGW